METPTQSCREKIRLMDEYDRTTAEFSRTVAVLNKHQGVGDMPFQVKPGLLGI